MRTERGFERIINFSDATVAIAMTLLVLPLVELGENETVEESVWALLRENVGEIVAFLLSFVVIWVMWTAHHRTLEYFRAYDATIRRLHVLWLLTIVTLPFTTQLLSGHYENGAATLYVGVLLLSTVSLHLITWHGRRRPELLLQDEDEVKAWLATPMSWTTALLMSAIFAIVLIFPALGAWPLLLLFLDNSIDAVWVARRRRRTAGQAPTGS